MTTPKNNLGIPHRRKIIIWLLIGLGIFWLVMLLGKDFGCSSVKKTKVQPLAPHSPVKSEVIRQTDGSYLVKWTGEGEQGFRLPDLTPGRYSLTWLSGKIVYSASGGSFPIWGADVYFDEFRNKFRYFQISGIRPHQIILVAGQIGSGSEELFPFHPGKTQIIFRTDGRPVFFYYHLMRGMYHQMGWNGSYTVFRLEKLD